MFSRHPSNGMTLLELMIGLIISLLILFSVMTLYLAGNKNYVEQSALNSIQENARIALGLLEADISMAGYVGCRKLSADFIVKNFEGFNLNSDNIISVAPNELTVRKASTESANLTQEMQNSSVLSVEKNPKFSVNDIAIISDCYSSEIFKVNHVIRGKDNIQYLTTSSPLSMLYNSEAKVSLFEIKTFKVKKTGRRDLNGKFISAMYLKESNLRKDVEIVEGIEDMEVSLDNINHQIVGVNVKLLFKAVNYPELKKEWYSYIALRQVT